MNFVLIGPIIEENLALGYLAAALRKAGYQADIISFIRDREYKRIAKKVFAAHPDAVGLSMTFQSRARGFLAVAGELRTSGYKGHITAGGHFASLAAHRLLKDYRILDSIIQGEAEDSIVALAQGLEHGRKLDKVPGIVMYTGNRFIHGPQPEKRLHPDGLPWPVRKGPVRFELGLPVAPLITSRGCRGTCAYCSITAFGRLSKGPVRSERTPEDVVDEMTALWRSNGTRVFVFHDDDFFSGRQTHDRERVLRFKRAIKSSGLPKIAFTVKMRPDDVQKEVFELLRDLGLVQVVLGIDNNAPRALKTLKRGCHSQNHYHALRILHQLDISVGTNLLLWNPDTEFEDLEPNITLMKAFPDQLFNIARTEPYEGALITKRLADKWALLGTYLGYDYRITDPRAELSWRMFRVILGGRCYPADGLMQTAIKLHWRTRLLSRFFASDKAEKLRRNSTALTTRIAVSTRYSIEEIIDYAAGLTIDDMRNTKAIIEYSLSRAFAIREEDTHLLAAVRTMLREINEYALIPGKSGPLHTHGKQEHPLYPLLISTAFAAAGFLAGCVSTGTPEEINHSHVTESEVHKTPGEEPGEPVTGSTEEQGEEPAETTVEELPEEPETEFTIPELDEIPELDTIRCVISLKDEDLYDPYALFPVKITYSVWIFAPEGFSFETFQIKNGTVKLLAVSPDSQRVTAEITVIHDSMTEKLVCICRKMDTGEFYKHTQSFEVYHNQFKEYFDDDLPCCDPPEDPYLYDDPVELTPLPPPEVNYRLIYDKEGLVFTDVPPYPLVKKSIWPQELVFGIGIRAEITGESDPADEESGPADSEIKELELTTIYPETNYLINPPSHTYPEISCSSGQVLQVEALWAPAGIQNWFRVTYSPVSPDESAKIRSGKQSITVRLSVKEGDQDTIYEDTLWFFIDEDSGIRIDIPDEQPDPESSSHLQLRSSDHGSFLSLHDLPLPRRYKINIRCISRAADRYVLEAVCPGAFRAGTTLPRFIWYSSTGRIEPLAGGRLALWYITDADHPCEISCAVQANPADLQVGCFRLNQI